MYSEDKNREILKQWEIKFAEEIKKTNRGLAFDGAVDEKLYNSASKKILFILREFPVEDNSWETSRSFCCYIKKNGLDYKTYAPIARWTDIVLNGKVDQSKDYQKNCDGNDRSKILSQVAIMNLTKRTGLGTAQKTNYRYRRDAEENIELLREQFNNLNPDYVFICMRDHEDWEIINKFTDCYSYEQKYRDRIRDTNIWFYVTSNGKKTFFFFRHPALDFGKNKIYEEGLISYMKSEELLSGV